MQVCEVPVSSEDGSLLRLKTTVADAELEETR